MSEVIHSDFTALAADEVAVCPECDSSRIGLSNTNSIPGKESTGPRYKCDACNMKFDTFVVRERQSQPRRKGLANKLVNADPSEVSR